MVARGGGKSDGELVFNGYRVSVEEDENVLEINGGECCTAV